MYLSLLKEFLEFVFMTMFSVVKQKGGMKTWFGEYVIRALRLNPGKSMVSEREFESCLYP